MNKPILDRATGLYRRARVENNDLTKNYRNATVGEAAQVILCRSNFLLAVGRVIKYRLIPNRQTQKRTRFDFDDVARGYLESNLDQFLALVRAHQSEFVLHHIRSNQLQLEEKLVMWLSAYCEKNGLRYVCPQLDEGDYLPDHVHLSDTGAIRVATMLVNELR